jgi:hypothetical protein
MPGAAPYLPQVHVDRPLTNISVAYIQDQTAFIAGKAAPYIPSDKKSDRYFKYTKDEWFRDDAQSRAPATESSGGGYDIDNTPSFSCIPYAYHFDLDQQIDANADVPLNMRRDATKFVTRKLLLRQEVQWASTFFTTGVWVGSSTATDLTIGAGFNLTWDDANSTPIEDVQAQQLAMLQLTGFEPNRFIIGLAVYQKLVRHPDVIDLIKYGAGPGNPAIANEEALAKIFGVEEVLVSKAVKNTAAAGATFAGSMIAGKNALLAYVANEPGIMMPSAMYSFFWTGVSDGMGETIAAYTIPMPWLGRNTVRIEAEVAFVHEVIGSDLGAFFSSVVA